jgi:very-short-patch-repair endonuclease
LEQRDVASEAGIAVTAPARTLLDLAAMVNDRALRAAVRRAQAVKRVSVRQLVDILERAGPRRGVARLRRIVATGPAPTRSELEDVVLDLMLRGGLAHPDVNKPLQIAGRRIVPDFRWADRHLIVEADGRMWHDNQLAREDDAERQALLEAHGERVIRVTWEQAVGLPAQTLLRFRSAGAPDHRVTSLAA